MMTSTWTNPTRSTLTHTPRFQKWGRVVGLLLLAGYLIFCHGCHGEDVDDELSVPPLLNEEGSQKTHGQPN